MDCVQNQVLLKIDADFHPLFYNQHTAMLLIDPQNGEIVEANPAACTYYGWGREEMIGMRMSQINLLPETETAVKMQEAMSSSTSMFFHFHHRLASGEIRDVEVHNGPIHIDGKLLLLSLIYDVQDLAWALHNGPIREITSAIFSIILIQGKTTDPGLKKELTQVSDSLRATVKLLRGQWLLA